MSVDAIDRLLRFFAGGAPIYERRATEGEIILHLATPAEMVRANLAEATSRGLVCCAHPLWTLTPKGRKQAYGFAAAPLSPMPADVAEELAAWKEGRREDEPLPWTDSHRREAEARLYELSAEARRAGEIGVPLSDCFTEDDPIGSEKAFRAALVDFDDARIDHEVAIVRQRVERPPPTLSRVSADDELDPSLVAEVRSLCDELSLRSAEHDTLVYELSEALAEARCMRAENELTAERLRLWRALALARGDVLGDLVAEPSEEETAALAGLRAAGIDPDATGAPDDAAPPSWTRRAMERLMADPEAIARFNAARLSPEAANLISACHRREGMKEAFEACLLAWRDDADRKAPQLAAALAWTPPDGVTVEVLHGSMEDALLVASVTIAPGREVPREVHKEHEESIVRLNGAVALRVGGVGDHVMAVPGEVTIPAGVPHVVSNASSTELASYVAILRRVAPAASPMAESVPPVEEDRGHILRMEPGEPSHLGECEKCGRTNVPEGEWCPADQGEC